MKTLNKRQIIEATLTAFAAVGIFAAVVPNGGVLAIGLLVAGGLATMAALEAKTRAY